MAGAPFGGSSGVGAAGGGGTAPLFASGFPGLVVNFGEPGAGSPELAGDPLGPGIAAPSGPLSTSTPSLPPSDPPEDDPGGPSLPIPDPGAPSIPIPEPASLTLLGTLLAAFGLLRLPFRGRGDGYLGVPTGGISRVPGPSSAAAACSSSGRSAESVGARPSTPGVASAGSSPVKRS